MKVEDVDTFWFSAIGGRQLLSKRGVFRGIPDITIEKFVSAAALGDDFTAFSKVLTSGGAKFVDLRAFPVSLEAGFAFCGAKSVTERDIRAGSREGFYYGRTEEEGLIKRPRNSG